MQSDLSDTESDEASRPTPTKSYKPIYEPTSVATQTSSVKNIKKNIVS